MIELLLLLTGPEAQTIALRVALSGACVCALVLVAARVLRRRSEPLRYGILFGGVVGLLLAPILVGVDQSLPAPPAPIEEEVMRFPAEMLPELMNPPAEEPIEVAATPPLVGPALLALWLLGTLVGIARLIGGLCKQRRAIVGEAWRPEFWTAEVQGRLAQKLGLRRFPEVRLSPAAPMPMVLGFWRPVIVLPEAAPESWGQAQWEAVLLHEGAHIARRDPWAVLAQRLAVALYWWCPLVHLLSRQLNALRESICDDYALQGPCDHLGYAELLIESAERLLRLKAIPVPLALLDSARGGLEARVTRLLEKERRPMTHLSLGGKLLAGSLLGATCLLTMAATALPQAQPQKKVQIKILIDGKEIDLSDLKVLGQLEAAQKAEPARPADASKPKFEDRPTPRAEGVAFSPDGKFIVNTDGKMILILDAQTGKILSKTNIGVQDQDVLMYRVSAKPDPRIEELVKQAEAIKPGSGAEIRRALQGLPRGEFRVAPLAGVPGARPTPPVPPMPPVPVMPPAQGQGGKKVVIVIEDGKVRQLGEQEMKKLFDGPWGPRFHMEHLDKKKMESDLKDRWKFDIELQKAVAKPGPPPTPATPKSGARPAPAIATPPTPAVPADLDALRRQLDRLYHLEMERAKISSGQAQQPALAPADVEALRRQVERLSADLQEMRKHLDAKKK